MTVYQYCNEFTESNTSVGVLGDLARLSSWHLKKLLGELVGLKKELDSRGQKTPMLHEPMNI
jgi:hypothetical protein